MTTTERDPAHGGYEGDSRSEPKEPPMTKTQDELKAAVERLEEDLQEGRIKDFAVSKDVACILAALRSPDPEVERLRGALTTAAKTLEHVDDALMAMAEAGAAPAVGTWKSVTDAARKARAALSSNSGGR